MINDGNEKTHIHDIISNVISLSLSIYIYIYTHVYM